MKRPGLTLTTVLALAAILLAGVALAAPALASSGRQQANQVVPNPDASTPPARTITVHGTGRVAVTPDQATVVIGVVERASTAGAAQSAAAGKMAAVIASLKKDGIAEADIRTVSIGLGPVYDYTDNTQKLIAYEANQAVEVKVRKLDATGKVVDNAVAAGASQIQSISLTYADPSGPMAQARASAVAAAKAKAQGLASAAGYTLGVAVTITESTGDYSPVPLGYGAGAPDKAATPVMAGSIEITVDVDISYTFS
jgi:uncharacterized protein